MEKRFGVGAVGEQLEFHGLISTKMHSFTDSVNENVCEW
jgi:hypothetical protein